MIASHKGAPMSSHRYLTVLTSVLLLTLSTGRQADAAASVGSAQWVVPVTGAAIVLAAVLRHVAVGDRQTMRDDFERGRRCLKTGEYDSAVQALERAVDTYENQTSPRKQRRADTQRLYRDAKRYLAKARELAGTAPSAHAAKPQPAPGAKVDTKDTSSAEPKTHPSPFEQDDQWGYRYADGRVAVEPQFIMAQPLASGGLAAVVDDSGWVYIDISGNKVIRPHVLDNGPDYFAEGLARFTRDGLFGFFDTTGTVVIEPSYEFAQPFTDGLAAVCTGCSLRVVDEHTEVVGGTWGFVDTGGTVVVPLDYERVRIDDGALQGLRGGSWVALTVSAHAVEGDTVVVRRNDELSEIRLVAHEAPDSLVWELATSEVNRGVVTARWQCSLKWETHTRLAERLLVRLLADTAAFGMPHTLFFGRLDPCTDRVTIPAQRLVRAAASSPAWDTDAGRPRQGHVNDFVVSLANEHDIFAELRTVFERHGLTLRVSGVEKVLVGEPPQGMPAHKAVEPGAKVPYDCMVWLAVEPMHAPAEPAE
ncbi:MAG: hypothetical protein GF331_11440 [Chitinivibrionales bacterium]|nr:hypothetical protein [Chitinivibrionales bacterium]